jgi:hypothetical protein
MSARRRSGLQLVDHNAGYFLTIVREYFHGYRPDESTTWASQRLSRPANDGMIAGGDT